MIVPVDRWRSYNEIIRSISDLASSISTSTETEDSYCFFEAPYTSTVSVLVRDLGKIGRKWEVLAYNSALIVFLFFLLECLRENSCFSRIVVLTGLMMFIRLRLSLCRQLCILINLLALSDCDWFFFMNLSLIWSFINPKL